MQKLVIHRRLMRSQWTWSATGAWRIKSQHFTLGVTLNPFCNCTIPLRIQFVCNICFPFVLINLTELFQFKIAQFVNIFMTDSLFMQFALYVPDFSNTYFVSLDKEILKSLKKIIDLFLYCISIKFNKCNN